MKWIGITFWALAFAGLIWFSFDRLPPQHNPLDKLAIDHPLGLATAGKLAAFQNKPDACFGFLEDSGVQFTQVDETPDSGSEDCGLYNALTLDQSDFPYSTTLQMTCALTGALVVWERQALIERAAEHFDSTPVKVLSFGSYACRRKYGRKTGDFSEHATGNAIDIKGIELADGRRITVLDDWGEDTEEGRFLKDLRDDSCRIFGTVLGPEYNDAHNNHFHFDMSQSGICE